MVIIALDGEGVSRKYSVTQDKYYFLVHRDDTGLFVGEYHFNRETGIFTEMRRGGEFRSVQDVVTHIAATQDYWYTLNGV